MLKSDQYRNNRLFVLGSVNVHTVFVMQGKELLPNNCYYSAGFIIQFKIQPEDITLQLPAKPLDIGYILDDMEQLGFDVNLIKKYQHAADRIPSLNPTTFQQQFNAIDTSIDGTGNNSITQKEIIAYLNQNPTGYNEEEALRIWDAYLQSYGKIPVFDPDKGTWSAK